jgi:hypothetical protein
VQVNRENIGEIAELVRQSGVKLSTASEKGGTKAELALINEDLTAVRQGRAILLLLLLLLLSSFVHRVLLEPRVFMAGAQLKAALAAIRTEQAQGGQQAAMIAEFGARLAEINEAKADRRAVDLALHYKADKVGPPPRR